VAPWSLRVREASPCYASCLRRSLREGSEFSVATEFCSG